MPLPPTKEIPDREAIQVRIEKIEAQIAAYDKEEKALGGSVKRVSSMENLNRGEVIRRLKQELNQLRSGLNY